MNLSISPFNRTALEQSAFREGYGGSANHQVIKNPDIDQRQRVLQPLGDGNIILGGFRIAAGVVVSKDDGGGIVRQTVFDDFAGVDSRAINGTPEHVRMADYPVASIQPEDGEDFMILARDEDLEKGRGGLGIGERFALVEALDDTGLRGGEKVVLVDVVVDAFAVADQAGFEGGGFVFHFEAPLNAVLLKCVQEAGRHEGHCPAWRQAGAGNTGVKSPRSLGWTMPRRLA